MNVKRSKKDQANKENVALPLLINAIHSSTTKDVKDSVDAADDEENQISQNPIVNRDDVYKSYWRKERSLFNSLY